MVNVIESIACRKYIMTTCNKSFTGVQDAVNIPITDAVVDISDIDGRLLLVVARVRKFIKLSNNPECVSEFTAKALAGNTIEVCKKYVKLEGEENE